MNLMKSAALMAMGAGAYMAYEKYKAPMTKKMNKMADEAISMANKKLDNMMK